MDRKATALSISKKEKYVFPAITKELFDLLNELGYDKFKGQDRYLIAPDEKCDRKQTISENLSKGFSHFKKFLKSDDNLMLKGLRRNYITKFHISNSGSNVKTEDVTGHSGFEVIANHYLAQIEIAESLAKRGLNL